MNTPHPLNRREIESRRENIVLANEVRSARAQVKRDLRAHRITFHDALHHDACGSMLVIDLARIAVHKRKLNRIILRNRIMWNARVYDLTSAQKQALADEAMPKYRVNGSEPA